MTVEELREKYPIGTMIHINHLAHEDDDYDGREGEVQLIDDIGDIHGSWGGLAIIPDADDFYVIDE